MNNQHLATKVKELRARKGFSQEQLSEESLLSLRTIQRIEKGETIPRGDTLLKLTAALGVTPDNLLEWAVIEDSGYLTLMNLAALGIIFHPILGIIIPLCMWILKRKKIQKVETTGKNLLSFQITWTIVLYIILFILAGGSFIPVNFNLLQSFPILLIDFSIFAAIILGLYLYNFALIFSNLRRIRKGKNPRYFPAIPFMT